MPDRTVPHQVGGRRLRALRVEVLEGDSSGLDIVADDTITIGTAAQNDLVLKDPAVSRFHLELRHLGREIVLVDLGSTNGTFVGAVRLIDARIPPGTILTLGDTRVRVDEAGDLKAEASEQEEVGGLRGRSDVMRRLMARISKLAGSDVSVLIRGETGVGKELVARALHECSSRKDAPFETVDCGSIAPALIASELFGHEKGAFTGADRRRRGAFERAHGGTLFLDEIGELPVSLQSALLGALERRSFRRVGGDERVEVDVRVISATLRELRPDVNAETFRPDLFYRLAVVTLEVPALRERPNDIPLLVEHFLRDAGHFGPVEDVIPTAVLRRLLEHRWPGNVRELRNFVEAALAMGEPPSMGATEGAATPAKGNQFSPELFEQSFKDARKRLIFEFESAYLESLLEESGGNISGAARKADVHRSYLQEMMRRHGKR